MPTIAQEGVIDFDDLADFGDYLLEYYEEELDCLPPFEKNGCYPPSGDAINCAWILIRLLKDLDFWPPATIIPTPNGGIAICFNKDQKYADFQCMRGGLVFGSTWDSHDNADVFGIGALTYVELIDAISRIQGFFSAASRIASNATALSQHPPRRSST